MADLHYRSLRRLKDKIARATARIRRQEMLLKLLPPGRLLVAKARLTAAKLRLADVARAFQAVADGVLVVSAPRTPAPVPDRA